MATLTAAVIILAVLTLLNLFLLFGVLRRLREQTAQQSQDNAFALPENPVLQPGSRVGAFTTTTLDGDTVEAAELTGDALVGFFSPTCKPCRAAVPRFADYAARFPREKVLAVVVTDGQDFSEYADQLAGTARVVVEPHSGPLSEAFAVAGFPGLCVLSDGVVTANGMRVEELPDRVPAHA
ncbi:redoxin domain-containing protein [Hamadaea sp. NPDC051192]|uniref:TlpA family protein disulfide reductase n=1 Tax=Hamadaea sp. NPDC051192 TaxID=3154940 RepID=UPI0034379CC9